MGEIEWRIYYEDCSVFDNTQGTWEDAPLDGVQVVAVADKVYGRVLIHGTDFFMRPPHVSRIFGAKDIMPQIRKLRWIKFGLLIPKEQFSKVLVQAADDPDFPKTSPRRRASDNPSNIYEKA